MDYFSIKRTSSSSLKQIDIESGGSPLKYKDYMDNIDNESEETTSLYRGSMIHKYCEDPDSFKVSECEKPSGSIPGIIEAMVQAGSEFTDISLQYYNTYGPNLYASWSREKRIAKLRDGGKSEDYYNHLMLGKESVILTKAEKQMMDGVRESLMSNDQIKHFLTSDEFESEKDILWEYNSEYGVVERKSRLDKVKITEDVIHIVDIKSTSLPVRNFKPEYVEVGNKRIYTNKSAFIYYKYYRQMTFYYLAALSVLLNKRINIEDAHQNLPKIIVNFIVVETNPHYESMVYNLSLDWLYRGIDECEKLLGEISWQHKNENTNKWKLFRKETHTPIIDIP